MATDVPEGLRNFVRQRAGRRCEYCRTSEELSGLRCQTDHIVLRSRQGITTEDNLCLACAGCNGHKQARTHAADPETGLEAPLFNPRQQSWRDHFAWSADGAEIIGLTPVGRATAAALHMNDPLIVAARALWVGIGAHPPQED